MAGTIRESQYFEVIRGDDFIKRIANLCASEQAMCLMEKWRDAKYTFQTNQVSYRQLNHWEENGLLRCQRGEASTGWRRFNLFESLWLLAIIELRRFGLSLPQVKEVMPFFFEKVDSKYALHICEYYVFNAMVFKEPAFFIISGSEAEFLNYDQYRTALEMKVLEHHFCINLNTHIEKLFKNVEIDMPFTESHDFESFELVYAMKRADFDKMTIHKKKGKVSGFDLEKTFPNTESQKALVADHPDCELTIKRRKNQVTSIRRKSTKKFNAQG
jgi:hypothetical protein